MMPAESCAWSWCRCECTVELSSVVLGSSVGLADFLIRFFDRKELAVAYVRPALLRMRGRRMDIKMWKQKK